MKKNHFSPPLFCSLFWIVSIVADVSADTSSNETNNGMVQYRERKHDAFEKIITAVPEAKDQYDSCIKELDTTQIDEEFGKKLETCLWEGKIGQKPVGTGLEESAGEKIIAIMSNINGDGNKIEIGYDSVDTLASNINFNDPAFKKLQEYFSKKLDEALYGKIDEKTGKKERMVGHETFYNLYKTQVSNDILLAISSYCIKANPANGPFYLGTSQEQEEIMKNNIKNLRKPTNEVDADGKRTGREVIEAFQNYEKCLKAIPQICYEEGDYSGNPTAPLNDTKKMACLVTNYIRKARQQLAAIKTIEDRFKNLAEGNKGVRLEVKDPKNLKDNIKVYTGHGEGEKTISEILVLSSNEAIKESGFEDANKALEEKIGKECLDDGGKIIKNIDICKEFLATDRENQTELLAENILRQKAMEKRLEKDLNENDEEAIKKYLKDEGHSEKEVQTILNSLGGNSLEKLKEKITNRFKAEKEALIASMADSIKHNSADKNDIDKSQDSKDADKVSKLKVKIGNRPRELKNILHFNNIVTSYLEITKGEGVNQTKSQNIAAFSGELQDYQDENNPDAKRELEEARAKVGGGNNRTPSNNHSPHDTDTGHGIDVGAINEQILRYIDPPKTP